MERRAVLVGVVVALILTLVGVGMLWRTVAKSRVNTSSQSSSAIAATTSPSRIMTKDPELNRLLHPPTSQDAILAYSKAYLQKKQEIDAKLASVNDPDLKGRMSTEEWAKVDMSALFAEGQANFKSESAAAMRAFIQRHRAGWFEIGHIDYPGSGSLAVKSVEASPVELPDGGRIALDIPTMDGVYSKFREAAKNDIQLGVTQWVYQQSCTAHLKNACENLGGSPSDCSDSAQISRQLQEAGILSSILSGCDVNPSPEEGQRAVEKQFRENRLVLVGQGDLLAHRTDKLLLVDYDTEAVLLSLSPTALSGRTVWKFPIEDGINATGSQGYKKETNTDSSKDFGVTPLHGESGHETFNYNNSSDDPASIGVTLNDDNDNDFVLQNNCSSGEIGPHESCDFVVYFSPGHAGLHTATIKIEGNWSVNTITLRGYGLSPWDISAP